MMNYQETLRYLYEQTPLFQHVGGAAYKEGLDNTYQLDAHFGHPHRKYKTIHIAGTNGKGSCAHTLASILQEEGYTVGLFTSPHLVDFRERIRVNGEMISQDYVVRFVEREKSFFEPLYPSFFEVTTAMAFQYFAEQLVDIAVIETGLGGRLDCTNIIRPLLSVITNIGYDHMQFLGNTLPLIAAEKAGIIKEKTPVVIGETCDEITPVFTAAAQRKNAPIVFAQERPVVLSSEEVRSQGGRRYTTTLFAEPIWGELSGCYQEMNMNTLLHAVVELRNLGCRIEDRAILQGISRVQHNTGLQGRWQQIRREPTVICDTGHNADGIRCNMYQLVRLPHRVLRIVIGVVNDKDLKGILHLLPQNAVYYFTRASVKRALDENVLCSKARAYGLSGKSYPHVKLAVDAAMEDACSEDVIYIGGSNFVVGDFFACSEDCFKEQGISIKRA